MSDTSGFQNKQTISWIRRETKSDIDLCYLSFFIYFFNKKKVATLIFKVVSGVEKKKRMMERIILDKNCLKQNLN